MGRMGWGALEEAVSLEGSSPPDVKGVLNRVARTLVCLWVRQGC